MVLILRLRDASAVALLVAFTLLWHQFGRSTAEECAQPLLLYTAHKTGTILAKHLAAAVNMQLGLSCRAALQVDYNCPPDVGAPPAELLRHRRRRLDDEGTMPCLLRPHGCLALIARDPRELVVSGYLYHRRGAPDNAYDSTWLNASMWSDVAAAASIPPPAVLPWPHVRFATSVSAAARPGGEMHGVLPPPLSPHESFASYLRRVPERLGLAAEASSALRLSVPATELVLAEVDRRRHDSARRGGCSAAVVVCLSELQASLPACEAALARLLAPAFLPQRAAELAAAAARSACPASSAGRRSARQHGSDVSGRERARLLRLVGEIDATLFNGSLAASARRLRCSSADETLLVGGSRRSGGSGVSGAAALVRAGAVAGEQPFSPGQEAAATPLARAVASQVWDGRTNDPRVASNPSSSSTPSRTAGASGPPSSAIGAGVPSSSSSSATGASERPLVFYLGKQKSGTTSFHSLMQLLGLQSHHDSHAVYTRLHFPLRCCARPAYWSGVFPDYNAAARELNGASDDAVRLVRASAHAAYSDEPWPLLWRELAERLPSARFVVWARNASRWSASMRDYFAGRRVCSAAAGACNNRARLLAYGVDCITEATRTTAEAAYLAHLEAVRRYFQGTGRLLEVDFSAADAARTVCEFVLPHVRGTAAARAACTGYSRMPHAQPNISQPYIALPNGERPRGLAPLRHVGSASLPRNATGCAHEPRSRSGWFTDTVRRTFAGFASVSR